MACFIGQCIKYTLILLLFDGNNASKMSHVKMFKAAVYEHAVILPSKTVLPVSRKNALENMMKNLNIYRQQTEEAAKQVWTLLSLKYTSKKLRSLLHLIRSVTYHNHILKV